RVMQNSGHGVFSTPPSHPRGEPHPLCRRTRLPIGGCRPAGTRGGERTERRIRARSRRRPTEDPGPAYLGHGGAVRSATRRERDDKYYSSGNYAAFARPLKPAEVDDKSAYLAGGGLAS